MDLQTISSQMKVVIQKHQIVVTEMRNDPQNPVLQKQLHDLQLEILSLNERQKQIVEDLRKNFGKKISYSISSSNCTSAFSSTTCSPSPQISNQEIKMLCSSAQKSAPINHKVTTTTFSTKSLSNCISTVHQTVPPSMNNVATPAATFTFKAPMGTVVLPNCSTANALISSKVSSEQKIHPVLVVPSPSNRSVDGPQAGVLLNLGPPIRVPQYPPRVSCPMNNQKLPQTVTSNISSTVIPTTVSSTVMSTVTNHIEHIPECTTVKSPIVTTSERQPSHSPEKISNKIDQKKKDFITALGLVTRDSLSDLKNKKNERKRRSTANPQFSNAALEEKWRNAAAAQALGPPQKRPRGRPRLETKPISCPANGICSLTETLKNSETLFSNESTSSPSSSISPPNDMSTPVENTPLVVNGIHKQITNTDEGKNVEQMLSGLCIVCTQPGDLVKCDTCAKQQHLGCMQPPLISRPQIPWRCPDCLMRTDSLTVVQSYDMLKAAKEDEKRKLLKKSLELRLKRSQLESRLIQLKELSGKQKNRQSELEASWKGMTTQMERFHNIIQGIQLFS